MTDSTLWLLVIGSGLATMGWRYTGALFAARIDVDTPFYRWISCVSYAMVAGLIARMILMPNGALAGVPLWIRLVATAVGFIVYVLAGQRVFAGVMAGVAAISLCIVWL
ncbi:MAG: AzlD domain-containing protein [Gammaproteobacteria bacterium]|nr:AzlD domain-containing protein [Gammaproteobacteria bacterium]